MPKYLQQLQIGGTSDRGSPPTPNLEGLHFYDTDNNTLYRWDGSAWVTHETGGRVLVSSGDQTPDYLINKLVAGNGVTITQEDIGSNETLHIAASGVGGGQEISGNTLQVTKKTVQTRTVLHEETLASGVAAFNISSIPQTYDHLELTIIARGTNSTETQVLIAFNGDTTAATYRRAFHQAGTSHSVSTADNRDIVDIPGTAAPADTFSTSIIYIPGYRQPVHKTAQAFINRRTASSSNWHMIRSIFWESTASISSIDLTLTAGNFDTNTYIQLIGIKEEDVVTDISGGNNAYSEEDVTNPPTDAEIDSAFGTPATVGSGFIGLINDAGAGNNAYIVASDGSNWWYQALTKAV